MVKDPIKDLHDRLAENTMPIPDGHVFCAPDVREALIAAGARPEVFARPSAFVPCDNCGMRCAPDLCFGGYCTDCAGELLALPQADREFLEGYAVEHCRAAGLNAVPRPCPEPVYVEVVHADGTREAVAHPCPACEGKRDFVPAKKRERYVRPRLDAAFSERDAADLEAYFRCPSPSPVWERSTFGAMCERLAANSRPHSADRSKRAHEMRAEWKRCAERPEARCPFCGHPTIEHVNYFANQHRPAHRTIRSMRMLDIEVGGRLRQVEVYAATLEPDAPACELMAAHGHQSEPSYDETDVWSFVDGRHAMRDTKRALELCAPWVYVVLEARFGRSPERGMADAGRGPKELSKLHRAMRDKLGLLDEVAPMTKHARDLAAARGLGATQLVADLAATVVDETRKHEEKKAANEALDKIRNAARSLLATAQAEYASASLEARNGTAAAPEAAAQ